MPIVILRFRCVSLLDNYRHALQSFLIKLNTRVRLFMLSHKDCCTNTRAQRHPLSQQWLSEGSMSRDIAGRFAAATALFRRYSPTYTGQTVSNCTDWALSPVFVRPSRGGALQPAVSRKPYTRLEQYTYLRTPGSVAEDICMGRSFQTTFGPVGRESRKVNGALFEMALLIADWHDDGRN